MRRPLTIFINNTSNRGCITFGRRTFYDSTGTHYAGGFVFGHFADYAGLYQPFFGLCLAGARVACPFYAIARRRFVASNHQYEKAPAADPCHADFGYLQSAFLCGDHVFDLCGVDHHRRSGVWGGLDYADPFSGYFDQGNSDFFPGAGLATGRYGGEEAVSGGFADESPARKTVKVKP